MYSESFALLSILRYIEASKGRLYNTGGDSVAPVAQAILLYTFENILKVLHPFMPFVTEELWQVKQSLYRDATLCSCNLLL